MRGLAVLGALVALLAGCTTQPGTTTDRTLEVDLARFSTAAPGGPLPGRWAAWQLGALKRSTDYTLVDYGGRTVLRARADGSASGLIHPARFHPRQFPILAWRWKITDLIDQADNTQPRLEDSPVRVVVAFDGDATRLPLADRLAFAHFRMFTQNDLPYATLMYIWENRAAPGTVIASAHTSRIKMIVAQSGRARVGHWCEQAVDLYADYRRAFGEDPPPIKWIGVMTDTDNTGARAHAYYGDIELRARPR